MFSRCQGVADWRTFSTLLVQNLGLPTSLKLKKPRSEISLRSAEQLIELNPSTWRWLTENLHRLEIRSIKLSPVLLLRVPNQLQLWILCMHVFLAQDFSTRWSRRSLLVRFQSTSEKEAFCSRTGVIPVFTRRWQHWSRKKTRTTATGARSCDTNNGVWNHNFHIYSVWIKQGFAENVSMGWWRNR